MESIKKKTKIKPEIFKTICVENYIIDFFCPSLKLVIEIDGDSHFINSKSTKYDIERENNLKKYGIKIIRFSNNDIYDSLNAVVLDIEKTIIALLKSKTPQAPL